MLNDAMLETAVTRNIISTDQANQLRILSKESLPLQQEENDDEGFRFASGFSDIFLALGVVVLLSGLFKTSLINSTFGVFAIAAICWGLSEVFATWQRRSLPAIVSASGFVYLSSLSIFSIILQKSPAGIFRDYRTGNLVTTEYIWVLPIIIFLVSILYYIRFKLPFSLFLAAGSFALCSFLLIAQGFGASEIGHILIPVIFISGLIIFAAAMYFDTKDPLRTNRLSDNAFWLHLVASPLIVHSIMWQSAIWLIGSNDLSKSLLNEYAASMSIIVLVIFLFLMTIALIIDRRAMLVSSLIYVSLSLTYIISSSGNVGLAVSIIPIIIGTGIIGIGIGWRYLRKILFNLLPLTSIENRLPPLRTPA